ncbi:Uncharacterized protein TCM_037440 [Theobroma cacao]|uniref:Uncharacterized protein n=1 Tax=Theobroma cacao TaxID=3641 RepID=A0A061GJS4_THECC|nr:Uncharacterized protein TCM_037440 [Theobroma cacao]
MSQESQIHAKLGKGDDLADELGGNVFGAGRVGAVMMMEGQPSFVEGNEKKRRKRNKKSKTPSKYDKIS